MDTNVLKADLHVHSRHSTRPSQWILQKLGCAESYTDPQALYRTALKRGMDLVTITDHNTIAGSLEIAHLPHTFVSEEITAYFPEDRCKLHVLAWNITEAHHDDITRLRENVYDLVDYLIQQDIAHAIAHPMYSLNDKLTVDHMERMVLLFRAFELNGSRDAYQNALLRQMLQSLDEAAVTRLADKHGMTPRMDRPWEKTLTAGSDDHSSLNIARSHTVVGPVTGSGSGRVQDFLRGIMDGRSHPAGRDATPETMAHNLYSIAYQFYKQKFGLGAHVHRDLLLRFVDRSLCSSPEPESGFMAKLHGLIGYRRPAHFFSGPPRSVQGLLQKEAEDIIWNDTELREIAAAQTKNDPAGEDTWFRFVNRATEKVMTQFGTSLLDNVKGADLFSVFNAMGSAGSLYAMLAPYFVAYTLFTRDREFCRTCRDAFTGQTDHAARLHVGHFTDTFYDVNGVALTLQMQLDMAFKNNKQLKVITCGPSEGEAARRPGVVNFTPVGSCTMPEYPELTLFYPPVLRMIHHCYTQNFTHIHSATPGPIGLVALAVARILKLPVHATYHTAFPQYVSMLTEDAGLEDAMWRYMVWYYNQMDRVYVPSHATGEELVARGIHPSRVVFYPRGIDTEKFSPAHRNGFYGRYGAHAGKTRLLYVGRISREKNMHVLANAFTQLLRRRSDVELAVVGDGPWTDAMKAQLSGLPVLFTGYLTDGDLSAAYASADVFVFPSGTDTFGNVVLEAQASALPVIVTDKGGPAENMLPDETGLMVPEGDAQALAAAMHALCADSAMRTRMSREARAYAQSRSFEAAFLKQWNMYRLQNVA
ncbi:glycosyltransferase [Oleidesulfovibrio alaskensis]|uniref:glycosyltransferase n=1 Tax=Oleidesulfovibrio alaskensis TaxID=58180 RepID=UPI000414F2AA|nr:glycosyltransferase [Oleidesulfovibrio alaskensis]